MVKIPTADSQGQLTTQTTSPKIRDKSAFTQVEKSFERTGEALVQVANKFEELETINQSTTSQTEFNERITKLKETAKQDPDFADLGGKYRPDADAILQETASKITNKAGQQQFIARNTFNVTNTMAAIRQHGRVRASDASVAEWLRFKDSNIELAFQAETQFERTELLQQIIDKGQALVDVGSLKEERFVKLTQDIDETVEEGNMRFISRTNPDIAIELIEQGESGVKDKKVLADILNDARITKRSNQIIRDNERKEKHERNGNLALLQLWENDPANPLTETKVFQMFRDDEIDKTTAKSLKKGAIAKSPLTVMETKDSDYLETVQVVMSDATTEQSKRMRLTTEHIDEGRLRADDASNLMKIDQMTPSEKTVVQRNVREIKEFVKETFNATTAEPTQANMIQFFLSEIAENDLKGESVDLLKTQMITEAEKRMFPEKARLEVGKEEINRSGLFGKVLGFTADGQAIRLVPLDARGTSTIKSPEQKPSGESKRQAGRKQSAKQRAKSRASKSSGGTTE